MSIPRFQGLPRKLNINSPDGRAYCDQLRESNNVAIQVFLDGVEQSDVVAYDQDRGVVEVSITGPLGMHANPEVRHGRVTLSLRTVEKKPAFNPYGWLKDFAIFLGGQPITVDDLRAEAIESGTQISFTTTMVAPD